jgi:2',3'-cyclic-nucleotide 2'-phosphodiesterase (5'-nucleotidase family)
MKKIKIFSIFVILFFFAFSSVAQQTAQFAILYTNDEHGWFEPDSDHGGAPGMMKLWETNEGYKPGGAFLVLSGGDMWTGPAISTWFEGVPMTEIMRKMGYEAAAVGNHEFDFKISGFKRNIKKQGFPSIAANMVEKKTGKVPAFIKPYVIEKVAGVEVGIIGLANVETPKTTFPKNVEAYDFLPYRQTVEKWAPILKQKGAQIIIIDGHIVDWELDSLALTAKKFDIPIITGGHSHQEILKTTDSVLLVQSGSRMQNYISIHVEYNFKTHKTKILSAKMIANKTTDYDATLKAISDVWKTKADAILSEKIGYCETPIKQSSAAMENLICDSWLFSFPQADISITNAGGIRQTIPTGDITLETPIGLMPFSNQIFVMKLTGTQVLDCIQNFCVGGYSVLTGKLRNGETLQPDKTYTVLTTDYLYSIDNTNFKKYDKNPYMSSVVYRQPFVDLLKSLKTSPKNPLNNYLDTVPRVKESARNDKFH